MVVVEPVFCERSGCWHYARILVEVGCFQILQFSCSMNRKTKNLAENPQRQNFRIFVFSLFELQKCKNSMEKQIFDTHKSGFQDCLN